MRKIPQVVRDFGVISLTLNACQSGAHANARDRWSSEVLLETMQRRPVSGV